MLRNCNLTVMDAHIQRKEVVKIWIPVSTVQWSVGKEQGLGDSFLSMEPRWWTMDGFVCEMRYSAQAFDATSDGSPPR
jgi:hypothetical protein